jgi:hypothetical protein
MTNQTKSLFGMALLIGMTLGWLDLTQPGAQTIVVGIAAAAFLLAYIHPNRAWVWASLIGGSIFCTHLLADWIRFVPTHTLESNHLATLNALIPAFLGAYLAVMVNWSLQQTETKPKSIELMGTKGNS